MESYSIPLSTTREVLFKANEPVELLLTPTSFSSFTPAHFLHCSSCLSYDPTIRSLYWLLPPYWIASVRCLLSSLLYLPQVSGEYITFFSWPPYPNHPWGLFLPTTLLCSFPLHFYCLLLNSLSFVLPPALYLLQSKWDIGKDCLVHSFWHKFGINKFILSKWGTMGIKKKSCSFSV